MQQAISYVRFSSHRQRGGSSVERQEEMIRKWLDDHPDYQFSNLKFKDIAKSGYHGEHIKEAGGFGKLLVAVKEGQIRAGDVVLVEAIDRTGRLQTFDMLMKVLGPILEAGVSIITLDDSTTYTKESINASQMYLLVAKIQAAHSYSEALSRRVSVSYDRRRRQAKEGVIPKRATPVWLTSDGKLRDDVVPHIQTAFELYISGVGKDAIAKRMRESGVERLSKCVARTVDNWLRNQAAIGKWVTKVQGDSEQVIDNVYEPIIEPSLFYKVQLKLDRNKGKPLKTTKHFLVGLVRCASCGKSYIVQNKDGKPHSLRCHSRAQQRGCINSHIVPKTVLDTIYQQTSMSAAMEAVSKQQLGVNDKEIVVREAELRELEKRVKKLIELSMMTDDMSAVADSLNEAKRAKEVAENALVILKSTVVEPVANHWNEMGKVWKLEKDDNQRLAAMLRDVGYAIVINPDGLITCTHSQGTYRYLGVDRAVNRFKVMRGATLELWLKGSDEEYPYHDVFQDVASENTWDEADYENLRLQYE